ncbi:hypothetical protein, conserved [Eimeria tenella]|uniref:Uncharacterized protein n=1 Tax=Eimeria tenella TaxID=5802 RepID=U6KGI3_EIMTE|nr:hypothetical protein, conserved [Eimeria tenella]CDJ37155.1 hypothetical protein, conserved [Eimeria tenella]|eukprot:XP_013227993.1 hypothetical protein, conserved [Eimeria tenella]
MDDTAPTAQYWDLVHGRGRVAYFISTRSLQKILKPILRLSATDAAAQVLLEGAHTAALTVHAPRNSTSQRQAPKEQQKRCRRIAQSLAPVSHTLLELMCGSRPTHVRLLHTCAVSGYVGVDTSQRALHLAREACKLQTFTAAAQSSRKLVSTAPKTSATEPAAAAAAKCVHEGLGSCMLLSHDCRMLSEELPLLQSRFILLVAGLDDIIARSTTDNTDSRGPCDEAVLQVLHSAAFALPVGGTLLLIEPTKHCPELLLSLYKALQHPVFCCRLLLCERAELVGPSRDVLLLRLRRHADASRCIRALEHLHASDIARLAVRKPFRCNLRGALEAPQAVQQAVPLCYRLSLIQQAEEMAFLLLQACREGNFLATTKLLGLGADVNRSSNGSISEPPLHAAIAAGAPDLVNLLIRHGAQPTESTQGDTASLAAELLLQEAVDAGLCLPEDLGCASSSGTVAAGNAHKEAAVQRSIRVLSWVEGEICKLSGGPPCGCCCTGEDFLQAAAGVPPVPSLIWPFEDPLEAALGAHAAATDETTMS